MTQRQKTPAPKAAPSADNLHGNAEAIRMAGKMKAALENIMRRAASNQKLSELPTTKERLLMLADIIEDQELLAKDIGFDMSDWYQKNYRAVDKSGHRCKTAACIAGSAVLYEDGKDPYGSTGLGWGSRARQILGIGSDDAEKLFTPAGVNCSPYHATAAEAAAVIRDFAETGVVDWDKIMLKDEN